MPSLVLMFSASVGLFSSVVLVFRNQGLRKEKWAVFSLILALVWLIVQQILLASSPQILPRSIYLSSYALIFLFGPVLLFYIRELTSPKDDHSRYFWWQLSPFISITLFIVFFFDDQLIAGINGWAKSNPSATFFAFMSLTTIGLTHLSYYLLRSFLALKEFGNRLIQEYSNLRRISLRWLRTLICLISIITFTAVLYYLLLLTDHVFLARTIVKNFSIQGLSVIVLILAYKSNQSPVVNQELTALTLEDSPKKPTSELLFQHLVQLMENKKPYLNPELRLNDLSTLSSIKLHQLSELINEAFGQNFFDFINGYRVEEVKKMLEEGNGNQNILSMAMDAGFNSKSAFNRAFKKKEGMSPTAYLKRLKS